MIWQDKMRAAVRKAGFKRYDKSIRSIVSEEYILDAIMEAMDIGVEEGDYQYAVEQMQKLTKLDNFEIIKLITSWMANEAECEEMYG